MKCEPREISSVEQFLPVNRTEHVTRSVGHYGKLIVRRKGIGWRLTWPSRMFEDFETREAAEMKLGRIGKRRRS